MVKKSLLILLLLAAGAAGSLITVWVAGDSNTQIADTETTGHEGHDHASALQDWCAEHSVPESQCTKCHPNLVAEFKIKNDWCAEHGVPESHCRLCNPDIRFPQEPELEITLYESPSVFLQSKATDCATNHAVIRFASIETVQRTGLDVVPAVAATVGYEFEAPGELIFDETQKEAITTSLDATVIKWLVEPGQKVTPKTKIAVLESPEMAELQSAFVRAITAAEPAKQRFLRADSLFARKLISSAEYEIIQSDASDAISSVDGIRGQLKAAGLREDDIELLRVNKKAESRWSIGTTINGILLERNAQIGARLDDGSVLATTADPNKLWVEAQVHERMAETMCNGQWVDFVPEGLTTAQITAKVFWVAQFVDPATRTITVRAKPETKYDNVFANRFGTVRFATPIPPEVVAIPRDAVQWEGCCNVVFVQEAVGVYRPHKVTLMANDRSSYLVTSGLKPGELVVVKGSFLLKTELVKTSLGAGCCGIELKS